MDPCGDLWSRSDRVGRRRGFRILQHRRPCRREHFVHVWIFPSPGYVRNDVGPLASYCCGMDAELPVEHGHYPRWFSPDDEHLVPEGDWWHTVHNHLHAF